MEWSPQLSPALDAAPLRMYARRANPLTETVEAWLRETADADDDELCVRVEALELALLGAAASQVGSPFAAELDRAGAAATATRVALAHGRQVAREVLTTHADALARALLRASTHAAALIAHRPPEVLVSQRPLPEATIAAIRREHETFADGARRPGVRVVTSAQMFALWEALCLSCRGRWVDLGDGPSRAALAAAASASELLGDDATPAGDGSADVVTLLFPPRAAPDDALERALRLLRPGGTGFAVTENLDAWRSMVMHLLAHPRVAVLDHMLVPLSAAELRAMAIEPYAPAALAVEAAGRRQPPLGWGLPLLFTAAE